MTANASGVSFWDDTSVQELVVVATPTLNFPKTLIELYSLKV